MMKKSAYKKPERDLSSLSQGKIPPQALDMEEAVLGALMIEKEASSLVMDFLKAEHFYKDANQRIFQAIQDLIGTRTPVDHLTVSERLRATGDLENAGGRLYIVDITTKVVSAANIEYHARIIVQRFFQRELIAESGRIQEMAFDSSLDIGELFEYAESAMDKIIGKNFSNKAISLGSAIDAVLENISKIQKGEKKLSGVPSGFSKLDYITAGYKPGELTIVAGRPGMGKTAFMLQVAINAARLGYPVAAFSLEMEPEQLAERALASVSCWSNIELKRAECDLVQLYQKSEGLVRLPLFLDGTAAISIPELRSKIQRMVKENNIALVVVDYLQLMNGEGDSREQEVSSVSRGLKAIAKKFRIPVLAGAQINRLVESRANRKPILSDLRESGSIEQDADIVQFVHRPAMVGQKIYEFDEVQINSSGLMVLITAKNRNGPTGEILLRHNHSVTKIYDYEDNDFPTTEEPPFAD